MTDTIDGHVPLEDADERRTIYVATNWRDAMTIYADAAANGTPKGADIATRAIATAGELLDRLNDADPALFYSCREGLDI